MTALDMVKRAFKIADETMVELLLAYGQPDQGWNATKKRGGPVRLHSARGLAVATLAEAAPEIIEAVEWLQQRGLAEVKQDAHGAEFIALKPTDAGALIGVPAC